MNIPPLQHPRWKELVEGKRQVSLGFLAVKLMVTRLQGQAKAGAADAAAQELYSFFISQHHLPAVQKDLTAIFG